MFGFAQRSLVKDNTKERTCWFMTNGCKKSSKMADILASIASTNLSIGL